MAQPAFWTAGVEPALEECLRINLDKMKIEGGGAAAMEKKER